MKISLGVDWLDCHCLGVWMERAAGELVLEELLEGNRRFVEGALTRPNGIPERRGEILTNPRPIAIVLGCADARVPPELVFDQGLGDLFVVRTAGNVIDDMILGTIEFGVLKFSIPLLLVLGHSGCGAITATVAGEAPTGHIGVVMELIAPSVEATQSEPGSHLENAIAANAVHVARALLDDSEVIGSAHASGSLTVRAAVYDMESGLVRLLDE
jgi:carbonic anhydrase